MTVVVVVVLVVFFVFVIFAAAKRSFCPRRDITGANGAAAARHATPRADFRQPTAVKIQKHKYCL